MKIFEIRVKVTLLKDINYENLTGKLCNFIDMFIAKNEIFLEKHKNKGYKNYCFDTLYPLEKDKIYKKDKKYTFKIRSIDYDFINYFIENLSGHKNLDMEGMIDVIEIIHDGKMIDKIYSVTPVMIKTDQGYWRDILNVEKFEKRIKDRLFKIYREITKKEMDEKFELYNNIIFLNYKPIAVKYKDIKLLGDKVEMEISKDPRAQEIAQMILGVGLGDNTSRGYGFVNYKWI